MHNPEITPEEVKLAVEQPDFTTIQCEQHIFYTKIIEGKGNLIVYALKDTEKDKNYLVQCADWLIKL